MTDAAYIVAGYSLTTGVLAGYAAWVIARRRALARTLGLDDGSRPQRRPAAAATSSSTPSPTPSSE